MDIDIDALLALDEKKRELLFQVEGIKAKQNEVSKQIPALKKAGEDVAPIFAQMKELGAKHFLVEQDNATSKPDPMDEARRSINYITKEL